MIFSWKKVPKKPHILPGFLPKMGSFKQKWAVFGRIRKALHRAEI
jgi:hypothetical protein